MQADMAGATVGTMQPSNAHHDTHHDARRDAHLTPERLAAFDDAPFTVEEHAHLATCAMCRAEQQAVAAVVAMAGALGREAPGAETPRLVEFEAIMAGLTGTVRGVTASAPTSMASGVAVGVAAATTPVLTTPALSTPVHGGRPAGQRTRWSFTPILRQAAAALLLLGGGAVLGRLSATAETGAGPMADRPFAVASFGDASFANVDDATAVLNQAQRDYERASLWLASNDNTVRDPEVYRARLAALDQMMEASRIALRDAPQDPVLNHYYLTAYSAREATLQALGGALPVDKTIERY